MGSLSDLLGCSRSWFNNFANSDPMRRAKLQQARIQASHALVDEALHIASNATPENERASRLKVDTLKWTAGKFNKVDYGEDKAATVNIDMGDLFNLALDKSTSLRGKIAIELPATPLLQGPGE